MSGYEEINGILHVDGIPLPQIAAEHGTPTYVYSSDVIQSQYNALSDAMKRALPKNQQPLLCYACKANSNIAILSYLRSLGSSLEIVSEGELYRGLKAGFSPNKIVATGVGKSNSEITAYLEAGIHQFNVESFPELKNINKIAGEMGKTAIIVLRLNPNVSAGGHHKISTGRTRDKFGISEDSIYDAYQLASDLPHIEPKGLSMHIGSQVFTVESFKTAFEKLPAIVGKIRDAGHTLTRLDIGGGFPIVYKDEKLLDLNSYAEWVRDIILPLDAEIIMEPGRYLVGNSSAILSSVRYMKETATRNFLVIDAAMNDLIRPTLYDAYHGIESVENRDAPKETYDVVGPICETADTFATERQLPTMKHEDLLVIKSAGAYGFCMASNYNTRPLPAEVFVHNGAVHLINARQTLDDVISRETIPEFLKT